MADSLQILKSLQHDNGLFSASPSKKTGYQACWIRDTIYSLLGLEAENDIESITKGIRSLFDIFKKHEYKIDWAIKEKPQHKYQYIHARYHPQTLDEYSNDWGNKQNDAIGAFLWKVGDLKEKGIDTLRDEDDQRILQKLVMYLASIEYWQDHDNGVWEENEEVHASSVGACVAGLKKIKDIVTVPDWLIKAGENSLWQLLPAESKSKKVDLALLSLIYPYDIVPAHLRKQILDNVEQYLVKDKGVIRYIGDYYYNDGKEAQWTFGLLWLAIIYKRLGDQAKYVSYLNQANQACLPCGSVPELYLGNAKVPNENTPLAWAQSLKIVAEA